MSRRKPLSPYLSKELRQRVVEYCAATSITHSQLAESAFTEFLDQTSDRQLLLKRLGRIERKVGKLLKMHTRDTGYLFDLLGAFIFTWMAHTPEIASSQRDVAMATAQRRLDKFQEYVARQILGDGRRRFLRTLVEEDLDGDPELNEASLPLDRPPEGLTTTGKAAGSAPAGAT